MAWIIEHQLNLMLFMSGICGILALMTLIIRTMSRTRKSILVAMELAGMGLLLFDRYSYIFRGDVTETGFIMVRVSNGLVFLLSIFIPFLVTQYLKNLYKNEGGLEKPLWRLKICDYLFAAGVILIIVSQFTDLYYTIDEQNIYDRASGYLIAYIVPVLMIVLQESVIIQYRKRLTRGLVTALITCIALPTVVSFVQIFFYGLSLTNITMVLVVIVFYVYALVELDRSVEKGRERELEFYKEAQQKEADMFRETTEALANAIDAKDRYTHGHSTRVAMISRMIAKEAGFPDEKCEQVYFAALLHDVGKIGIHDDIINKVGKLTDEEFEEIKRHPTLGNQILSSIRQTPSLAIGAHYHHERYDGKGYPDGLAGEEIPDIARIIAVADAYDAMTSSRSYRDSLPMSKVREELEEGKGTQFDPEYAEIMLRFMK